MPYRITKILLTKEKLLLYYGFMRKTILPRNTMKTLNFAALSFCILAVSGIILSGIAKASEGTVTTTVTVGVVSVSVTPTSFDYGAMPFNATRESFDIIDISGDKNIKATVGTLLTDLDIKGADTAAWTLHQTTVGNNQYVHKFGTSANATTRPGTYTGLTTSYVDNVLATEVVASSSIWFGLQMLTPTAGTATQQSSLITVLATWSE